MSINRYILTFFILLSACVTRAQDDATAYERALEAYEFGYFEKADSLLKKMVGGLKGEVQSSVGVEQSEHGQTRSG